MSSTEKLVRVPRHLSSCAFAGWELEVASSTVEEAVERLRDRVDGADRPVRVCYANAHTLNLAYRSEAVCRALREADELLNDGIGVTLAARLQGHRFPANLHGSAFNLRILELAAREGWTVFLLGAEPGVAREAATGLEAQIDGLEVVGCRHGFHRDGAADAAAVRATNADVVMVAMGQPRQELWLVEHLEATGARLGVGVGAFLDFQAGRVRRAPEWANRLGVEWLHRLVLEPQRLWRRYLVGNPLFVLRVLRQHRGRGHR